MQQSDPTTLSTQSNGYWVKRGLRYNLDRYRIDERHLSRTRQADPIYSEAVRFGLMPWTRREAKLRRDEVLPLLKYADHVGLDESSEFIIEPFGQHSAVDAVIISKGINTYFQILTAGPSWPLSDGRPSRHGQDRQNADELMRDGRAVSGFCAIERRGGQILEECANPSTQEVIDAYRTGLVDALLTKCARAKCHTDEIGRLAVELLVRIQPMYGVLSRAEWIKFVASCYGTCTPIFVRAHLFEDEPEYIWHS